MTTEEPAIGKPVVVESFSGSFAGSRGGGGGDGGGGGGMSHRSIVMAAEVGVCVMTLWDASAWTGAA